MRLSPLRFGFAVDGGRRYAESIGDLLAGPSAGGVRHRPSPQFLALDASDGLAGYGPPSIEIVRRISSLRKPIIEGRTMPGSAATS